MFKKNRIFYLLLILVIGLIFRLLNFQRITFGYDQARDAFMALDIIKGDHLKISGPNTDIFGLNHGVLYWYLLSPFLFFFNGNIFIPKIFLLLVNLVGVILIFFFASKIFKNEKIGLISALLFAVSFEATQYAGWLSNPSAGLITILLTIYGLWLLLNDDQNGLFFFFIFWPMSVQFEFFLVYYFVFFLAIYFYEIFVKKIKINFKKLILSIVLSGFIFSTMILEQIKYGFRGAISFLSFASTDQSIYRSFFNSFYDLLDKIANTFYFNFSGVNLFIAGLLMFLVFAYLIKSFSGKSIPKKPLLFSLLILFSPVVVFPFQKTVNFVTLGNLYGAIFIVAYILNDIAEKKKKKKLVAFFLILILLPNLFLIKTQGKKGNVLFSVQQNMNLFDEMQAIDWIYKDAGGQVFSINTVTNPLFINTTWAYLFNYYAKPKYKYMPAWSGAPQPDVFGGNVTMGLTNINVEYGSRPVVQKGTILYLIMEPDIGIPWEYYAAFPVFENTRSKLVTKKKFGDFTIEKRVFTSEEPFSRDKVFKIALKPAKKP